MAPPHDDIDNALRLLLGIESGTPIEKTTFPSATTCPTDQECRTALVRILRDTAVQIGMRPLQPSPYDNLLVGAILSVLADSIESGPVRHLAFKNRRGDRRRDWSIARLMHSLRKHKGYDVAAAEVAEKAGTEPRQVKRISSKSRLGN